MSAEYPAERSWRQDGARGPCIHRARTLSSQGQNLHPMMLAEAVQAAEMGQGTVTVLVTVVAIPALGALVKWWMSGTERSIKAVAEEMRLAVAQLGHHERQLGVLEERSARLREDLTNLQQSIERRKS